MPGWRLLPFPCFRRSTASGSSRPLGGSFLRSEKFTNTCTRLHRFKDEDRRPWWCVQLEGNEEDRLKAFLESLTSTGRQNLAHIHFFAQMYWLQASVFGIGKAINMLYGDYAWTPGPMFVPRIFSLTVRSSDWYEWVNDEMLRMKFTWLGCLLRSFEAIGVQTFRLELETVEHNARALRQIIERIKDVDDRSSNPWTIRPCFANCPSYAGKDRSRMVLQEQHEKSTWAGFARVPCFDSSQHTADDSLAYRVITLIWKRVVYMAGDSIRPGHYHRGTNDDDGLAGSVPTNEARVGAARRKYEQRCQQEGSLLKFGSRIHGREGTDECDF